MTLLKPEEVAERLNVSRRTAYNLISSGDLPSVAVSRQLVRVDEKDLNEYIASRRYANTDDDGDNAAS